MYIPSKRHIVSLAVQSVNFLPRFTTSKNTESTLNLEHQKIFTKFHTDIPFIFASTSYLSVAASSLQVAQVRQLLMHYCLLRIIILPIRYQKYASKLADNSTCWQHNWHNAVAVYLSIDPMTCAMSCPPTCKQPAPRAKLG